MSISLLNPSACSRYVRCNPAAGGCAGKGSATSSPGFAITNMSSDRSIEPGAHRPLAYIRAEQNLPRRLRRHTVVIVADRLAAVGPDFGGEPALEQDRGVGRQRVHARCRPVDE